MNATRSKRTPAKPKVEEPKVEEAVEVVEPIVEVEAEEAKIEEVVEETPAEEVIKEAPAAEIAPFELTEEIKEAIASFVETLMPAPVELEVELEEATAELKPQKAAKGGAYYRFINDRPLPQPIMLAIDLFNYSQIRVADVDNSMFDALTARYAMLGKFEIVE